MAKMTMHLPLSQGGGSCIKGSSFLLRINKALSNGTESSFMNKCIHTTSSTGTAAC